MWCCPECREQVEDSFEVCWNCGTSITGVRDPGFIPESTEARGLDDSQSDQSELSRLNIILTTTSQLDGRRVTAYLGIVSGDYVLGTNVLSSLLLDAADLLGAVAPVYESAMSQARQAAMVCMSRKAQDLGADAVLSVKFDYEALHRDTLMVTCTGTAVRVTPDERDVTG